MSTTLVPAVFNWSRQNPEKNAADFPLADFLGSSSTSVAPAPAAAPAPAPAPAPDVLGGASSLAELDALTVPVTPALFNKCIISRFRCLSDVSRRRHVFADRHNPSTILYTISDQKVDVGKATILKPKEPLFHSRPIPRTSSRFPWPVSNRATRIWLLRY